MQNRIETETPIDETTLIRFRSNEIGGRQLARYSSNIMDRKLTDLANRILPEEISLLALGGYGRQELCPASDVDLMFLHSGTIKDLNPTIEKFLYTLWDNGLKVGHSTRCLKDCAVMARSDLTALTSMLDARLICGNAALFEKLNKLIRKECEKQRRGQLVSQILKERDNRHKRLGDTRYVLEPNIKEGKGGLRDFQTLFWLADILYKARTPQELADLNILTRQEARRFGKAHEYLMTVRCHLHDIAERAEERLHFDIQPELARRLGYRQRSGAKAVERFMKHYFLVTRDIGDLTRIVCAAIEVKENSKKQKPEILSGFRVLNDRLDFAEDCDLENSPDEIIRIFRVSQQNGLDIHPLALRQITKKIGLIDDRLRYNKSANDYFIQILTDPKDAALTLRRMNEAGILGRFIPQFGKIIALMQFDRYHVFTVDEHTIRAIDTLHKLEQGKLQDEAPAACSLFSKIENRKALYTAMFLHDICKGRGGNHSLLGAEMALTLCSRLGLNDAENRLVSWLIFDHLIMSDVAFKRDLEDPKTIEDFAFRVYDPERLRLLLTLTTADIMAVGPGRWTSWKAKLLEDLYNKAEAALKGRQPPGIEEISLPEDLATGETRVDLTLSQDLDVNLITVYSPDKPGLFATIAGGLSAAGANIIEARINTLEDGTALDNFKIQNFAGKPFNKAWRQEQVKNSVLLAIKGELDIDASIASHVNNLPVKNKIFDIPVKVRINNRASRTDTVIEITARDRPGLLYSLTCAMRDNGLIIRSAKITTHGLRAIDVFYAQDQSGSKLTDDKKIRALRSALKAACPE